MCSTGPAPEHSQQVGRVALGDCGSPSSTPWGSLGLAVVRQPRCGISEHRGPRRGGESHPECIRGVHQAVGEAGGPVAAHPPSQLRRQGPRAHMRLVQSPARLLLLCDRSPVLTALPVRASGNGLSGLSAGPDSTGNRTYGASAASKCRSHITCLQPFLGQSRL